MADDSNQLNDIEQSPPAEKQARPGFFYKLHYKCGTLGVVSIGLGLLVFLGVALNLILGTAVGWLAGIMVGGGVTALFACGMIAALKRTGVFSFVKSLKRSDIILIASFALFIIVFYCIYMSIENYIYYWDYGSYWSGTMIGALDLIDYLFASPVYALVITIGSINIVEYNSLISLILAFPLFITGSSYFAYYLLVVIFFYLPAVFIFSMTVFQVLRRGSPEGLPFGMVFGVSSLVTAGIFPVLYGYVDAFCLLPSAIFISIVFKHRFLEKNKGDSITAAFMLVLTAIGRRYFLYLVIGLTAAVLLSGAVFFIVTGFSGKPVMGRLKSFVYNMLIVAGVALLLLFTVFIGFTVISLFGNYAFEYAAYQSGNLAYNFGQLFLYYGWIICVLAAIGIVFAVIKRRFFESSFMLVQFAVTSLMFFLVQSMGVQHYYTVFFPMVYFVVLGADGIYGLIAKSDRKILKAAGMSVLSAVMVFNFLFSTVLGETQIGQALSTSSAQPKTRDDKETLMQMTDDLYSLTEGTDDKIYVAASGHVLNDDILRKLYMPAKSKISGRILNVAHVDLRDGFYVGFWTAEVVVTTSPCEYHLGETNQRAIGVLNNAVSGTSPLNDNFEKKESYTLAEGVVATVWQKTSGFDQEDGQYLIDRFNEYYAEYPWLFADRIKSCM